jgi:hypothetical protein
VLLLAEVNERLKMPRLHLHVSETPIAPKRRWAGSSAVRRSSP